MAKHRFEDATDRLGMNFRMVLWDPRKHVFVRTRLRPTNGDKSNMRLENTKISWFPEPKLPLHSVESLEQRGHGWWRHPDFVAKGEPVGLSVKVSTPVYFNNDGCVIGVPAGREYRHLRSPGLPVMSLNELGLPHRANE